MKFEDFWKSNETNERDNSLPRFRDVASWGDPKIFDAFEGGAPKGFFEGFPPNIFWFLWFHNLDFNRL